MLGITVIPTSATKKNGLDALLEKVLATANDLGSHTPTQLGYGVDVEAATRSVSRELKANHPELTEKYPLRWLALKLIERDNHVLEEIDLGNISFLDEALHHLRDAHGEDIEALMADARYSLAAGLTREVFHAS